MDQSLSKAPAHIRYAEPIRAQALGAGPEAVRMLTCRPWSLSRRLGSCIFRVLFFSLVSGSIRFPVDHQGSKLLGSHGLPWLPIKVMVRLALSTKYKAPPYGK